MSREVIKIDNNPTDIGAPSGIDVFCAGSVLTITISAQNLQLIKSSLSDQNQNLLEIEFWWGLRV